MPSPPPNSTPPNPVIPNAAPTTDDVHGTVMTLSQETIDMFRFSENYRREREAARERARKRKEARKLRLHTTSSPPDTAHPDSPESPDTPDFEHQEPPPDTLVLYDPPPDALHVRLLHTVVNDGYRHTCDEDVTLWPVLPLRL
ncbi:hypothetical protein BZG36_02346 [Bifiguratus adelaidae]|uniref:Uncharacterized protein n=1 Tax=Bifiguratus adelaidae TaxID=1938954 RepID=A0A261Y2H0_9FUNG|nr:hypothetical protein BZG36_02346 [Bifiguratus adelaidae]